MTAGLARWALVGGLLCVALAAAHAAATNATPPDKAVAPERTLDEAPRFVVGEWWTYRVHDLVADQEFPLTRIAASGDGNAYRIGLSEESFTAAAVALWVPSLGRVSTEDLSYDAPGGPSDYIDFPLYDGKTWDGFLAGELVHAKARARDSDGMELTYRSHKAGQIFARGTWDAAAGVMSEMEAPGFVHLRLEDHGFGYSCPVIVPNSPSLVVDGAAPWTSHDRHVYGQRAAVALYAKSDGGVSAAQTVTPSGETLRVEARPQQERQARHEFVDRPVGEWINTAESAGASSARVRIVSFHVGSIGPVRPERLNAVPSGDPCVRSEGATVPRFVPDTPTGSALRTGVDAPPFNAGNVQAIVALWGVGAAATVWLFWRQEALAKMVLWPLYSKVSREDALEQPVRARIIDVIRAQPGLRTQEIRREVGIAWGHAVYHLSVLEQHGLVQSVPWGRHRHWFDTGDTDRPGRLRGSLARRAEAQRVLAGILRNPGIPQVELAQELGLHHTTVSFHGRRLERMGLVERRRERGRLRYFPHLAPPADPPAASAAPP